MEIVLREFFRFLPALFTVATVVMLGIGAWLLARISRQLNELSTKLTRALDSMDSKDVIDVHR